MSYGSIIGQESTSGANNNYLNLITSFNNVNLQYISSTTPSDYSQFRMNSIRGNFSDYNLIIGDLTFSITSSSNPHINGELGVTISNLNTTYSLGGQIWYDTSTAGSTTMIENFGFLSSTGSSSILYFIYYFPKSLMTSSFFSGTIITLNGQLWGIPKNT